MLDHIGFDVSDITKAKAFYDTALEPLGCKVVMEVETPDYRGYGYGRGQPDFWIASGAREANGLHVAFAADTRADVDAFHAAALAAGGRDNGGPGLRPHYHKDYYAAFVLDPDGNNIEAVCHSPA